MYKDELSANDQQRVHSVYPGNIDERHEGSHHHNSLHGRIVGLSHFQAKPLLQKALVAALISSLLFIFCSARGNIGILIGLPTRWMYVVAHLLGAFGNTLLLWAVMSFKLKRKDNKVSKYDLTLWAVYSTFFYHFAAALAYTFVSNQGFYIAAYSLWWLRALLCIPVGFRLLALGDSKFRASGVTLIVAIVSSCPLAMPGYMALAQWIVAKLSAVLLALVLYYCAQSKYYR